jgi:hypothetical protein
MVMPMLMMRHGTAPFSSYWFISPSRFPLERGDQVRVFRRDALSSLRHLELSERERRSETSPLVGAEKILDSRRPCCLLASSPIKTPDALIQIKR